MATGVEVDAKCLEAFQDLKLKKKYQFIIYRLAADLKKIEIAHAAEKGTYEEFIAQFPAKECRYAVYDFVYKVDEGERHKILFYTWAPDDAAVRQKMVYAGSKDALRRKFDGVFTEIQGTDLSEVAHDTVLDKVTTMAR